MIQTTSPLARLTALPGPRSVAPKVQSSEAPPTDEVSLSAERPASAGRGWLRGAALGGLVVACAVLSGCGTQLSPQQLGTQLPVQTAGQDAAQALKLEIIPNEVGKVDIIRQTHEEESTDINGEEDTDTVKDDLQPVGLYLGNGLFLDRGMNLSLVPTRIFNEPVIPQDFQQAEIQGQFGGRWNRTTLTQQGNVTTIQVPGELADRVTEDGPDQTTYQFGTFFKATQGNNRLTVTREGNQTVVQPPRVQGWESFTRIVITQEGNTTRIHPHWTAGTDITITREGNKVTVSQFLGQRTTITRADDGTISVRAPLQTTETIQRGSQGLNHSDAGSHRNIQQQGEQFLVSTPGGGRTTITLTR
jgi:hypothetical protein